MLISVEAKRCGSTAPQEQGEREYGCATMSNRFDNATFLCYCGLFVLMFREVGCKAFKVASVVGVASTLQAPARTYGEQVNGCIHA